MSYYYKYKFVSPEIVYAEVKEELKSYFDTGIIDDVMFPRYTDYCLRKLGRVAYKISEIALEIKDFQATLPQDFYAVRELYGCFNVSKMYQDGSATYEQVTSQVTPYLDNCKDCVFEDKFVTMKTTGQVYLNYSIGALLKPGNINTLEKCSNDCGNLHSNSADTFDIHDNKLVTNFSEGFVHLIYYKIELDDNEWQLIPDIIEFHDYLKSYIKYKCFETVLNSITDETFNQVERKYLMYKQEYAEKFIIAQTEFKKQTIYDITRSITKSYNRFNNYEKVLWGRRGNRPW